MKRDRKTLFQEIEEFMEEIISGVDANPMYSKTEKPAVRHALKNALGRIREMKGSRTIKRINHVK